MATILKTKNSVTTTVVPSSLAQGELAVNIADKKVWVGNASSTPVLISDYSGSIIGGSNTQVQYNNNGVFAGSVNMTFDGTNFQTVNILPTTSGTKTLGSTSLKWSSVYASELADGTDQLIGTSGTTFRVGAGSSWTAQAFYTGGSERMRIDSSGNVGIGVTPSSWNTFTALDINTYSSLFSSTGSTQLSGNLYYQSAYKYKTTGAATLYVQTAGTHQWYYAASGTAGTSVTPTEAMRIDSSGDLFVGTSSTVFANRKVSILGRNSFPPLGLRNNGTSAGKAWEAGPDFGNSFVVYNQNGTGVYLADGATSWTANSDERLKTVLTPFENAVDKVCSLRSGIGRYLTDDENVSRSFLIAQDIQKVLPEAVDVQDDEQKTLGLRYTDVVPLLVAAIQEQQAMIKELQAKVAALEAA